MFTIHRSVPFGRKLRVDVHDSRGLLFAKRYPNADRRAAPFYPTTHVIPRSTDHEVRRVNEEP